MKKQYAPKFTIFSTHTSIYSAPKERDKEKKRENFSFARVVFFFLVLHTIQRFSTTLQRRCW